MSTKENELALRVEVLEVTLAYQTTTIEDLNRALTEQWKIIDQLTRGITQLADRVQAAESRATLAGPAEPPPPHY